MPKSGQVVVRTPSTIGNFGPGFDATSLAIEWGGDVLTATPADQDRITLRGPLADRIPTAWDHNCAAVAYGHLRDRFGSDLRVHFDIEKGAPPGSGLGSSASSSAAGALAFAKLHPGSPWDADVLVQAATYGEARVAGAHGDDVAAAVQGGLAIVGHGRVARITPPDDLWLAIVRPDLVLETKSMRAAVGKGVTVPDAVHNLANLAFLIDAMHRGDVQAIARCLGDRVAAPGRRPFIPFYDAVQEAAVSQGAAGIAIAGSGPSLFTVAQGLSDADRLAGAMAEAVRASGVGAEPIACRAERRFVWQDELSS